MLSARKKAFINGWLIGFGIGLVLMALSVAIILDDISKGDVPLQTGKTNKKRREGHEASLPPKCYQPFLASQSRAPSLVLQLPIIKMCPL